jgi:hypothetical protein
MRLIITTLATVAALAVSAVAFAAGTAREEVNASTRGTSNIAPGGKLKLVLTRKSGSQRFHIRINYAVTSRRGTTIGFAVHPCRSTACSGASTSKSRLSRSGNWTVNYNGNVRVQRRAETGPSSRVACVYAQLRDLGADGEGKGRVIRRASGGKGIVTCMNVGRADD